MRVFCFLCEQSCLCSCLFVFSLVNGVSFEIFVLIPKKTSCILCDPNIMGYLLSVAECRLYQPVSGCKICPILKKNWFCLTHLCRPVSLKWRFYFQWSLSTLYLLACQVGVTVGDTGLCFCVPCYTCDVSRALCKRVEAIQISCHLHPPLRL